MAGRLFRRGVNPNIVDSNGWTALRWAVWHGHTDIIELLLSSGASVDLKDKRGDPTLIWALDERTDTRRTPITRNLTASGSVQMHIGSTYDLRTSTACPNWITPWPARCSEGVVGLLISHTKGIDHTNRYRRTPLMQAASNRQFQHVSSMLARGANIHLQDLYGMTALLCALQSSTVEFHVPAMTLDGTASVHIGDHIIVGSSENLTSSERDVEVSIVDTINQLVSSHNIEAKAPEGRSALALAAASGQDRIVETLLRLGADVDSIDDEGMTPLLWACRRPMSRRISTGPINISEHAKVYQGLFVEYRGNSPYPLGAFLENSYAKRVRVIESMLSMSTPKQWFCLDGTSTFQLAESAGFRHIVGLLAHHTSSGSDAIMAPCVAGPELALTRWPNESSIQLNSTSSGPSTSVALPSCSPRDFPQPAEVGPRFYPPDLPTFHTYGDLELLSDSDSDSCICVGDMALRELQRYGIGHLEPRLAAQLFSATLNIGPVTVRDSAQVVLGNIYGTEEYGLDSIWTRPDKWFERS